MVCLFITFTVLGLVRMVIFGVCLYVINGIVVVLQLAISFTWGAFYVYIFILVMVVVLICRMAIHFTSQLKVKSL